MRDVLPVFRRSIRESWRSLLGWSIGIAAVLFLYLPIYPSFGASEDLQNLLDSLPSQLIEALGYDQLTSGAGYVQSTYFGQMGFLLLTIAAVLWGAAAIAGAEESGRIELDLAHGIGRMQYALESGLSVLVRLLWLGVCSGLVIWALDAPSRLELDPLRLVGASAALTGLAFLTATAALLAGAATGRRVWATGIGTGVAVLGYVLHAVSRQADDLAWLRTLSPYAWVFDPSPLAEGADAGGLALTWGIAVVLAVASAPALRARDLRG